MGAHRRTATALAASLTAIAEPDLFGHRADPDAASALARFRHQMARGRRRDAVASWLAEPWLAWSGTDAAARIARRYLRRHPQCDRPDPDLDLLTDRQQAATAHYEEVEADFSFGRAEPEDFW